MQLPASEHVRVPLLDGVDEPVDELELRLDLVHGDSRQFRAAAFHRRRRHHDIASVEACKARRVFQAAVVLEAEEERGDLVLFRVREELVPGRG